MNYFLNKQCFKKRLVVFNNVKRVNRRLSRDLSIFLRYKNDFRFFFQFSLKLYFLLIAKQIEPVVEKFIVPQKNQIVIAIFIVSMKNMHCPWNND